MYQTTISSESENQHYLKYLDHQLHSVMRKCDGVCVFSHGEKKSYLSIACAEEHKEEISQTITTALAEILSVGYKNRYFKEKLKIKADSFLHNVVVNTMCIFDVHKDKKVITRNISEIDNLSIEGYCNFRLKDICEKWDEIINITNAYDIITSERNIIKDFLVFLVESIPVAHRKIFVTLGSEKFSLFDENNKTLNHFPLICSCENYQESLMHNLICHRSKAVSFIGSCDKLSKDFWDTAKLLFVVERCKN